MIPYDDLVAALSAWRARQGLPVSTMGGASSGPAAVPGSGPHSAASPGSGPMAKPGSGPNRGAPPASPPARAKAPSMPPPMAAMETQDEHLDVDDSAMLEEHYENEGDDFAMAFNPNAPVAGDGEETAIGQAPERPTEADMGRSDDRDDW